MGKNNTGQPATASFLVIHHPAGRGLYHVAAVGLAAASAERAKKVADKALTVQDNGVPPLLIPFPPQVNTGYIALAGWIRRFRNWTLRLPHHWGLGRFEIHSALPVMLILMASLFLLLSFRAGFEEFRTVAITLPIVWAGSLVVRLAAQQLAIGDFAHDARTIVGPTGNVQTEYEFLPPRAALAYALSGQLASIGLMSIGMVVGAAMEPAAATEGLTTAELLDFRGGWSSRAWASQILWVNVFLFVLHLLPTVPFDLRAAAFAAFTRGNRSVQEPLVFRRLALLDSHLAAVVLGVGLASAAVGWSIGREIAGWYAFFAAAVYLFVASQWEQARADDLEEQYVPTTRVAAQQPQLRRSLNDLGGAEAVDALLSETEDYREVLVEEEESLPQPETLDIDEILRKVYRSGVESLSPDEQQALLSASRKMKDKRNSM